MNTLFHAIMDFLRHIGLAVLDAAKAQSHTTQIILVLAGFVAWSAFFYWVGYGDGREDKKKASETAQAATEPREPAHQRT